MMTSPRLRKRHVGLDEPVSADHQVDRARGQPFQRRLDFLGRAEARQLDDPDRELGEAVGEHLEVLLGQQRRRHEHRDLPAVAERHERGAQRDFGLAETDIATDQPVHRLAGGEILDDGLDRRLLVRCLVEGEAFRERFVIVRIEPERMTLARGALGIEVEQLGGGVVRLAGRTLLRLVPLAAAELVQRCRVRRRATVAPDQVQVRDRYVELRVVRIDELQELRRPLTQVHRDEAQVATDAVLLVDDRIADPHLGQVAQHRVDVRPPCRVALSAPDDSGVELGLGDEREPCRGPRESGVQRRHDERALGIAGDERAPVLGERQVETVLREVLVHRLAPARAFGTDQHADLARRDILLERDQRIGCAAIDLDRRQRTCAGVPCRELRFGRRDGNLQARMWLQRAVERVGGKEHGGRRQQRPGPVAAQQPVARFGVLPEPLHRIRDIADERDRCVLRQVVGQGRRLVEEQRQVVLDAAGHHAVADVLVERRAQRVAFEDLAVAAAKARAGRLVGREFACRQQAHIGHRVERALRIDVERLDALDVVAEEVEPEGKRASHRKEIDQPAAHTELAGCDDLRHVLVAGERQLRAQRVDIERRALAQEERERREIVARREPVERRRRRDDEHVAFSAGDPVQRCEPLRDEVLVRREVVVGQGLPIGQQRDPELGREPGQLVGESLGGKRIGADHREQALAARAPGRELGEGHRIGGTGQCRRASFLAGGGQRRDERGQRGEHRNARCGDGGRGRGGVAARCGGAGIRRRDTCHSRRPVGGIGRRHVQLRIERGLYAATPDRHSRRASALFHGVANAHILTAIGTNDRPRRRVLRLRREPIDRGSDARWATWTDDGRHRQRRSRCAHAATRGAQGRAPRSRHRDPSPR